MEHKKTDKTEQDRQSPLQQAKQAVSERLYALRHNTRFHWRKFCNRPAVKKTAEACGRSYAELKKEYRQCPRPMRYILWAGVAAMILCVILLLRGCGQTAAPAPAAADDSPKTIPVDPDFASAEAFSFDLTEETEITAPPMTPPPTPTPTPSPTPSPTPTPDPFAGLTRVSHPEDDRFFYVPLNDTVKSRITGTSYPTREKDAPVPLSDLRYVKIIHVDFEGREKEGELIVHRLIADDVLEIFYELYMGSYPLTSVLLVDEFGEKFDDNNSMAANNTSSYCYRKVSGSKNYSLHAYGLAIDINPLINPYINGSKVSPPAGVDYLDRTQDIAGLITEGDYCYRVFTDHGFSWGGFFASPDYQHFSKDLRKELG